jgi:hypothetical protein
VNAVSSLAFALSGFGILLWATRATGHERLLRIIFGTAMIATGIGSYLFHGYDNRFAQFAHDITFLVTIWILAVINVSEVRSWNRTVGWGVVGIGVAVFTVALVIGPGITNVITILVTVALVASDVTLERVGGISRLWWVASLVAMTVAVVFFLLGRTGGIFCDPEGLIQGHGLWHVMGALALTLYFIATSRSRLIRLERS